MKRMKTLLLVGALTTGLFATSYASTANYDLLASMNIMTYSNGDFDESSTLNRAMLAKILLYASEYKHEITATNVSPFPDVHYSYWYSSYISTAVNNGLVRGYLDGNYRPNDYVKLEEAVTAILNVLGYDTFTGSYPTSQISKANSLGLLDGVSTQTYSYISRADMATMICNMFEATTSDGVSYSKKLGYDSVTLSNVIDQEFDSAIIATSTSQFSEYKIYVDGKSASTVPLNSLVYANHSSKIAFAYTEKISGTVTAISPNKESPTSVTIGGKTYNLSTNSVKNKLSMDGISVGDYATFLVDRNGGIGEVITNYSGETIGIIIESGTSETYDGYYITLLTTDGNLVEYEADKSYSSYINRVAKISSTGSISLISTNSNLTTSGNFESLKTADNIKIINLSENSNISYPSASRMNGVYLSSSNVLYVEYNDNSEIETIILDDVTNDTDEYVYLTSMNTVESSMNISSTYTYDYKGNTMMKNVSNSNSSLTTGPSKIIYSNNTFNTLKNLSLVSSSYLKQSGNTIYFTNGLNYKLADDVGAYKKINNEYFYVSISDIDFENCMFYYDKTTSQGGAIRIIVEK